MADAFIQIILKRISSLIEAEIGLIISAEKEMKKLGSILTTIEAVLEDAENKQLESRPIHNWLVKLNHLILEIDDILDECTTQASMLKSKNRFGRLKKILFHHKIGRRMKQLIEELDAVAAERAKFHLRELDKETSSKLISARETTSFLNDTNPSYGREVEKDEIVDILVNRITDNQDVSILPIIGLGGLGKTTLAQLVFKDPRVVKHFDKRFWACVPNDFDLKTLVNKMIESATEIGSAPDLVHSLEASVHRLLNLLKQKRYLLVLDDVWNEDPMKWSELRNVLACGSTGSAIIVTTRMGKVADLMGTLPTIDLKGLSEDTCWMLIEQQAFRKEEMGKYPKLEAIGKQLAKKCGGVPLAAKAVGGFLRFKRTEKEWIYVNDSEFWKEETEILPALRLSYHHLPSALKQCFAYCAVFPKGSLIYRRDLIFFWMAHGYISSNDILEAEDIGYQIWNELVARSLFHNVEYILMKARFTMHDLVHDLARSIVETKVPGMQMERISSSSSKSKVREVNLSQNYVAFHKSNDLKTIDISFILKNYSRLRVLNASEISIEHLPSALCNMNHLRLLNLSGSSILTLPKALCNLWNLQTLNLEGCRRLVGLPKNIRYLKNLRHLLLVGCISLIETPPKIRELTSLKTLGMFIVGHDRGHQLEELEHLNLGGSLVIRNLEKQNPMDAKKANMVEKSNLLYLRLEWGSTDTSDLREDKDEKVLEALQPHPNIKSLKISGFCGRHFPYWVKNLTLDYLCEIEISNCPKLLQLYKLEELLWLKVLYLRDLAHVEFIGEGGNVVNINFPSLVILQLNHLPNLKGLLKEESKEMFPNLRRINIELCPLLVLPQLSSLRQLEEWDCDSNVTMSSILGNLKVLKVKFDENMKCIPLESLQLLTQLKQLHITGAHEHCLPEEGLQVLNSLQVLRIHDSNTLTGLPKGWLRHVTTLKSIEICNCSEFVELPEEIKCLPSLRYLMFVDLPKMVRLPESIRALSSLEYLELASLPQLTSMPNWLGELTSLHFLDIFNCPKLASLPARIQGMSNLKCLYINNCPDLERRCEERKGEDWHKIAHIPNLRIGW